MKQLVAVLVDADDKLDWLPVGITATTCPVLEAELPDDRAMAINGQRVGLAFARHFQATEQPSIPPHMIKGKTQ